MFKKLVFFLILISCCSKREISNTKQMSDAKPNGVLVIITGPSGSGKTTIAHYIEKDMNIKRAITHTTRNLRPGEKDKIDYYFIDKKQFEKMIADDQFIEYSNHFNNFYGLAKKDIEIKNNDVMLVINEKGALEISRIINDYIVIYLKVDKKEIKKRILSRDSKIDKAELKKRIDSSVEDEKILDTIDGSKIYKINTHTLTKEQTYQKVKSIILSVKNAK